jgi:large subunit ribosomal protein L12
LGILLNGKKKADKLQFKVTINFQARLVRATKKVKIVLTAAGITVDPVQIKALVASLSEVNIDEAIKAAPMMAAQAAPAAAAPVIEKPKEEDKKKKAEEDKAKEEAALEGLGALFG